jgi:hypothetical protein
VANPMLVPKKNTKVLCMWVDYTGLNKACPKDPFPLPRIDQVIDSTVGSELLCFLDAYSGYHQIKMKESDQLVCNTLWHILLCDNAIRSERTQEQCTNAPCKSSWQIKLDETSTHTWTTSPSYPKSWMTF